MDESANFVCEVINIINYDSVIGKEKIKKLLSNLIKFDENVIDEILQEIKNMEKDDSGLRNLKSQWKTKITKCPKCIEGGCDCVSGGGSCGCNSVTGGCDGDCGGGGYNDYFDEEDYDDFFYSSQQKEINEVIENSIDGGCGCSKFEDKKTGGCGCSAMESKKETSGGCGCSAMESKKETTGGYKADNPQNDDDILYAEVDGNKYWHKKEEESNWMIHLFREQIKYVKDNKIDKSYLYKVTKIPNINEVKNVEDILDPFISQEIFDDIKEELYSKKATWNECIDYFTEIINQSDNQELNDTDIFESFNSSQEYNLHEDTYFDDILSFVENNTTLLKEREEFLKNMLIKIFNLKKKIN